MRKLVSAFAGAAAVLVAAGCKDPLEVRNLNNPDVERAYATPAGIEQVIGSTYQAIFIGIHGSNTAVKPQLMNMAFESYASVANNGMALRAALPRLPILNGRGNQTATEDFRDFSQLSRASRTASNGVIAIDRLVEGGRTLGTPAQNARARAFAFFTDGVALGELALVYDSAAIVTPAVPSDAIPSLSAAKDVMIAALAMLDSALAIAQAAPTTGTGNFPLPTEWIRGNPMSRDDFVRFIRSYKALFRSQVARTPAERAAVDWTLVIADAEAGITSNVELDLDPSSGWTNAWIGQHHIFLGWHQQPLFIVGMADSSGGYDAWLATPLNSRAPFLIRTLDRRFPAGDTRAAQNANSPTTPTGVLYFRNRPSGSDTPGEPWGTSFYDHYRFIGIFQNANKGRWPIMTKAEVDLTGAEGYIRKNQFAQAAALIDRYRTRVGLPSLVAANITSATQPVPGGRACVPHVPAAPSFTSTQCGNIFEAMKWEKRMETAFTNYSTWYFDARGWGDLPEGTTQEYPVPFQELDARRQAIYNLGGVGGMSSAPKGTYGF